MKSKSPCNYLVLIPSLTWVGGGEEIGAGGEEVATSPINTYHAVVFTPFNTSYPQQQLNVSYNFNFANLG